MTTALITGATSGIGRATADKLARSGVHVIVVGRNAERGAKTIAKFAPPEGKPISFRPILVTRRTHARLRAERLS
ncbi:MAG TPA: SDR family NAD(P)-dependent oxidoreductase [Xanthobacteraceae bacterium]|jgi:NAD(P)-dependent dehydrogenase (short-subunit alcohol dehydrogenase family)|nr:SDR family NAD(P)-dependent oxidoreductase [Xanthobacteraceae bacterium]